MQEIQYVGERLWAGKIGNAFVLLAFVFSIISTIAYYFSVKNTEENSWKKIARTSFYLHAFSTLAIVGTLFYMLLNQYFEFHYVWQHSNKAMPIRYIFSCFWEGQEGSFLLWSFWHCILGIILIKTSKNWEAPVMTIFSSVQVFLSSMLLGIYFLDVKIGSNPFTVLLRDLPDWKNIPLFKIPNYVEKLDGRGLNPLLQNYWMTIHPPTLFLGFASTLVPFAFAIAGLWTRRLNDWQKPALPWTFFGVMILGTGILMGGAWAYEALSFGGFWAWDPVENASLVPWLLLVGAAHVMLVNKNKRGSLFTTFLLTIGCFILILYSTFLTRSGILGESSVHAFTDLGMSGQLLLYLLFFTAVGINLLCLDKKLKLFYTISSVLLFSLAFTIGYKSIILGTWGIISIAVLFYSYFSFFPKEKEEEDLWSREFWMFIGALVLVISAFQITYTTSIPVINKLFNQHNAPPVNAIEHYNSWQLPFAIIICVLVACTQYLKYLKTDLKVFLKKISIPSIISVVVTVTVAILLKFPNQIYSALLFASIFAAIANAGYAINVLKGNIKKAGASIAHIGFGLLILGALISTSKKETISVNTSGKSVEGLDKNISDKKNILLQQYDTLKMGNYLVTYKGKEKQGINIYFVVDYFQKDTEGKTNYAFTLKPMVQLNARMGNIAEPDTKHYLDKDIYTHVTYADLELKEETSDEYMQAKNQVYAVGDTSFSSNAIITLDSIVLNINKKQYGISDSAIAVGAKFKVRDVSGKEYFTTPIYVLQNKEVQPIESEIKELGLKFVFWKINPEDRKIEISLSEKTSNTRDFIVMEAYVFPYINILWMGCIVMIIGTIIAITERIKKSKVGKNLSN